MILLCKKLRDVQQERESTSLNYFKVIFNYIKQFSWSILVYLGLSWSILLHLGLFATLGSILEYLGLFRTVLDNLGLSWTILDYL